MVLDRVLREEHSPCDPVGVRSRGREAGYVGAAGCASRCSAIIAANIWVNSSWLGAMAGSASGTDSRTSINLSSDVP